MSIKCTKKLPGEQGSPLAEQPADARSRDGLSLASLVCFFYKTGEPTLFTLCFHGDARIEAPKKKAFCR